MVERTCKLSKNHSFFLFGARGTGKTTLLEKEFSLAPNPPEGTLLIDLLDPDQEEIYSRNPSRLRDQVAEISSLRRVIIDEIQKAPALLDVIHSCIRKYPKIQFIMTGSSARKLKHGGANLLAGRAFSFFLHPLTFMEAPPTASLIDILSWGTLPKIFDFSTDQDRQRFLRAYTQTYLKQEVQIEQLVRDIHSFREFLDLAAQCSGEVINYANIAAQSGVDEKTVSRYFEILVDTMVGHFLEPYDKSVRVRQSKKPKFFLFDTGIQRHLSQMSDVRLSPGSSEYGRLFEQMIVCECIRLNDYFEKDFRFYYLRTKDGAEIDLIVKKPGKKQILIEIKSTDNVLPGHCQHLISLSPDIPHKEKWVLCNESSPRKTAEGIRILPWKQGLAELFEALPEN